MKVPNDQKVPGKSHLPDHRQLELQPLLIFRTRDARREAFGFQSPLQADPGEPVNEVVQAAAVRRPVMGQVASTELQLDVAAFGDLDGILQGLGKVRENASHFLRGLHVELVGLEPPPIGIMDGLSRLDAQENFMSEGVAGIKVVTVIGGKHWKVELPGQGHEPRKDSLLLLQAVVLKLDVVPPLKQLGEIPRGPLRALLILLKERLRHRAVKTRGRRDEPLGVFLQQVPVDAGFVVEALQMTLADKGEEVPIALLVHGEKELVIKPHGSVARGRRPVEPAPLGDVELAPEDGFDAVLKRLLVKLDGAEEVAVVGDGQGGQLLGLRLLHQGVEPVGPVQQTVLGVKMKVTEIGALQGYGLSV